MDQLFSKTPLPVHENKTRPAQFRQPATSCSRVVLHATGLRKVFGGQIVLDGVQLELREGEVVLLRGDNGSGKTTLLNILTGNLEPESGHIWFDADGTEEKFHFPRRWWQNLNPFDHFTPEKVASEAIGRTWQDIRLFQTQTLRDNIAVATPRQRGENPLRALLARRDLQRDEETGLDRARDILGKLGLAGRETSSADKISLGQMKRVAIARAVAAGAKVLFLDEPLAGLDRPGVQSVVEMLAELARSHRITLVMIEHVFNIPRILEFADTVWTLSKGKLSVEASSDVRTEMRDAINGGFRGWFRKHVDGNSSETLEELPGGARLTRFRRLELGSRSREVVLELRDLIVVRARRRVIGWDDADGGVAGLNLKIHAGEVVLFEASNGWGKTTLMEAIMGLLPIESGAIFLRGKPIHRLPVFRRARMGISCMQSRTNSFGNLTVEENFHLVRCIGEIPNPFAGLADRQLSSLSGGERQRVLLATICPSCLGLYDECFSALDMKVLGAESVRMVLAKHDAHLLLFPRL